MGRQQWCVAMARLMAVAVDTSMIDDFEDGNASEWLQAIAGDPLAMRVSTVAAHDGAYGFATGTIRTGWVYRDDAQAHVTQGDRIRAWTQLVNASCTRNDFGFGATAEGCFSAVLGDNTNTLSIHLNVGYGHHTLASTPSSFINRYSELIEVVWGWGGSIAVNLFDSDGVTPLATVSAVDNTYTEGGVALRSIDSGEPAYWDTIVRYGLSPAESQSWGRIKAMYRQLDDR